MLHPVPGKFMGRLAKAIGIDFPCERFVIECDAKSHCRVYIVAPADLRNFNKVCDEFEAIAVEGVVPLPWEMSR